MVVNLISFARQELGSRYIGRPLRKAELARLLGLSEAHGAEHIGRLEKGTATLGGPVRVVLLMLLADHRSPRHAEALASRYTGRGCKLSPEA